MGHWGAGVGAGEWDINYAVFVFLYLKKVN